ncbi:MAG: tetratricopeptide repeat-containing sensor histidine kinase [Candidatus Marinimicrobia bacterium]|nr:tetratricopeptide repeat-containing sensor histidine kinase [Candidatus Neomarinimicrobiota bacterium]
MALNLLCDCKFSAGMVSSGKLLAERALELQKEISAPPQIIVRTLNQIANNHFRLNNFDESLKYYTEALKIHKDHDHQYGIALITGNMAIVYKQKGNISDCIKYCDKALMINRKIGNEEGVAINLHNKGAAFFDEEKLEKSARIHLRALKIREKLENKEGIAQSLGCIGICFSAMKKYNDALDYLNKALQISKQIGNGYLTAHYLSDIAEIYNHQHDYKKSLKFNFEALEQAKIGGLKSNETTILIGLSSTYLELGKLEESLDFALQAYENTIDTGELVHLPGHLLQLSNIYLTMEDLQKAMQNASDALNLATEKGMLTETVSAHLLLSNIYKKSEMWENAFHSYVKYSELNSEFLQKQRGEKIAQMQARYETEHANRKAEIYRLKNVKLVQKNKLIKQQQEALTISEQSYRKVAEKLAESNSIKALLLDIIAHDLKNPVGVIFGMSQMVKENLGENSMVDLIASSSESLLKVLEHATSLSKVSAGDEIKKDDLNLRAVIEDVLLDFSSQLNSENMEIIMNIPDDVIFKAHPLVSEIFENYISNAIKYANEGKSIHIKSEVVSGHVVISISDLGKTISSNDRLAIFERTTQLSKGEKHGRGLGLAIAKKIAQAHQGECWVEPNHPQGNSFCVRLPL